MEDNNKLFVFEKKEIFLIFLFVVLIAIISFTLGVRTGKSLSLKHDEYSAQDVKTIDLKSVDEEYVDKVVPTEPTMKDVEEQGTDIDQNSMEARLKEEMEKLATQDVKIQEPVKDILDEPEVEEPVNDTMSDTQALGEGRDFSGKYTIQLFAHQSQEVAQDFADGFLVKGYDVIINEANIPGKGKWYRVSIGVFDNQNQAKEYLEKEKGFFQSKDYVIKQF